MDTSSTELDQLDLDAVRQRFVDAGFDVSPWPYPDSGAAGHAVVVTTRDLVHRSRLDEHRYGGGSASQVLPTDRVLRDWRPQLREAINMLRIATGDTHADLGPTTAHEAAFTATGASAEVDAVLQDVRRRIGGLPVHITVDDDVSVSWRRSYDGIESDSRHLTSQTLQEALTGIIAYEDDADRADEAAAATAHHG